MPNEPQPPAPPKAEGPPLPMAPNDRVSSKEPYTPPSRPPLSGAEVPDDELDHAAGSDRGPKLDGDAPPGHRRRRRARPPRPRDPNLPPPAPPAKDSPIEEIGYPEPGKRPRMGPAPGDFIAE